MGRRPATRSVGRSDVLDEEAVVGTYWWGKRRDGVARPRDEWLSIRVTPIVDAEVYALAQ